MGTFATLTYTAGHWSEGAVPGSPALTVEVHDSDIATIEYRPAGPGSGTCYLGCQPRIYFESPGEHPPVALDAEAAGLQEWAAEETGTQVDAGEIRALLAPNEEADPLDVFVEDTVAKLCALLGLSRPPGI